MNPYKNKLKHAIVLGTILFLLLLGTGLKFPLIKKDFELIPKSSGYWELDYIYVNDAFGTAHRAHASTTIVADFFEDRICGYLIQSELVNADKVLQNAERPFTAIMGGAKVSDKILLIEQMLEKVDNLLIGGGMSYTFAVAQGGNVGNSLLEADKVDLCKDLIRKAQEKGAGFETDTNKITIIGQEDNVESLPLLEKWEVAQQILNRVEALMERSFSNYVRSV